jgi:hypothetical protein
MPSLTLTEDEILHLEPKDDVAALRARLAKLSDRRVIIVVAPGNRALAKLVNLRLIQRIAAQQNLQVALVTSDYDAGEQAHTVGLPVFGSIEQVQRAAWPMPTAERQSRSLRGRQFVTPTLIAELYDPRQTQQVIIVAFVVTVLLCCLVLAATMMIFPSAVVTITPVTMPLTLNLTVQASPTVNTVDFDGGVVPARLVETNLEGTGQLATSGRKDVPDALATGTIVFTNKLGQAITIPAGTVVRTTAGTNIRFRTDEEVVLPEAVGGRASVGITAVDPGPIGNVKAGTINAVEGSLALSVNVINNAPTSGGSVRQAAVVVAADKDKLRDLVVQKLRAEGHTHLTSELKSGEFIPFEAVAVTILDETFDHGIDDVTDVLKLQLHVVVKATVVDGRATTTLIQRRLEAQVPSSSQLIPESVVFHAQRVTKDEGGTIVLHLITAGRVMPAFDEETLRGSLVGKSVSEARNWLAGRLVQAAPSIIQVSPSWFGRMPFLASRIRLEVNTQGAADAIPRP